MYQLHCTQKLLDRIKPSALALGDSPSDKPRSLLGNWYATALFWKPQLALLVNERTLLPVLMPLAPAATLAVRFPQQLALVLSAHGIAPSFIDHELSQMGEAQYAKTANRSVVGIMNQFSFMTEGYRDYREMNDLLEISLWLAQTPCKPLLKSATSPERELRRVIDSQCISSR